MKSGSGPRKKAAASILPAAGRRLEAGTAEFSRGAICDHLSRRERRCPDLAHCRCCPRHRAVVVNARWISTFLKVDVLDSAPLRGDVALERIVHASLPPRSRGAANTSFEIRFVVRRPTVRVPPLGDVVAWDHVSASTSALTMSFQSASRGCPATGSDGIRAAASWACLRT
jgi:hypothetical protein